MSHEALKKQKKTGAGHLGQTCVSLSSEKGSVGNSWLLWEYDWLVSGKRLHNYWTWP